MLFDTSASRIPVVLIFAPTATGKTALTERLFGKGSLSVFKGMAEAVSADSQAVYRYLDVGTAKPTRQEQEEITYHLIDVVDPDTQFGVFDFVSMADRCIGDIWKRGKLPVVVGGTGFYFKNLMFGLTKAPESNLEIRNMLHQRIEKEGLKQLYWELKQVDREYAKKISINDSLRICRGLEVYLNTGKPLSSFEVPSVPRKEYDFCTVILKREREDLYDRIDRRVDLMFQNGLPEEIEKLKKNGYGKDSPGLKAIGYSEFFLDELGGNLELIRQQIKNDSRKYARKQYTYMKEIPGASIISGEDYDSVLEKIKCFIEPYVLD